MSLSNKSRPEERIKTLQPFIKYKNGKLFIEDISYFDLIEKYGTPLFVFSKNRIKENIRHFSKTFGKQYDKIKYFYPYRANYLPNILDIIITEGWGAEVNSSFEYKLAKSLHSAQIILNGFNRKLYTEIINDRHILYIAVDSLEDAKYLNEIGEVQNKSINIGLRVHPDLGLSQKYSIVPRGFKLGYDIKNNDAEEIVLSLSKMRKINMIAINSHIAIRQTIPDLYVEALRSMIKFADKLYKKTGINIKYINIGGGFESRNLLEQMTTLDCFAIKFSECLSNARKEYTLILEPGRFIISDTSIVLTEVLSKKINTGHKWLIVDVGINTLIPLKSASFDVIPTKVSTAYDFFNVGDYISSSMGIIKENIYLPQKTNIGDILAIVNTGAYTLSMSEQFSLLRPNVVLVDEKDVKVIKTVEDVRETIERLKHQKW